MSTPDRTLPVIRDVGAEAELDDPVIEGVETRIEVEIAGDQEANVRVAGQHGEEGGRGEFGEIPIVRLRAGAVEHRDPAVREGRRRAREERLVPLVEPVAQDVAEAGSQMWPHGLGQRGRRGDTRIAQAHRVAEQRHAVLQIDVIPLRDLPLETLERIRISGIVEEEVVDLVEGRQPECPRIQDRMKHGRESGHPIENHGDGPIEAGPAATRFVLREDLDGPATMGQLRAFLHDTVVIALRKVSIGHEDDQPAGGRRKPGRKRVDTLQNFGQPVEARRQAGIRREALPRRIEGPRLRAGHLEDPHDDAMRCGAPISLALVEGGGAQDLIESRLCVFQVRRKPLGGVDMRPDSGPRTVGSGNVGARRILHAPKRAQGVAALMKQGGVGRSVRERVIGCREGTRRVVADEMVITDLTEEPGHPRSPQALDPTGKAECDEVIEEVEPVHPRPCGIIRQRSAIPFGVEAVREVILPDQETQGFLLVAGLATVDSMAEPVPVKVRIRADVARSGSTIEGGLEPHAHGDRGKAIDALFQKQSEAVDPRTRRMRKPASVQDRELVQREAVKPGSGQDAGLRQELRECLRHGSARALARRREVPPKSREVALVQAKLEFAVSAALDPAMTQVMLLQRPRLVQVLEIRVQPLIAERREVFGRRTKFGLERLDQRRRVGKSAFRTSMLRKMSNDVIICGKMSQISVVVSVEFDIKDFRNTV